MLKEHEIPIVEKAVKNMSQVKTSVEDLVFQFRNFSVSGENKAYLVTGNIPEYIKHLVQVEEMLTGIIKQLMDAGAAVITPLENG